MSKGKKVMKLIKYIHSATELTIGYLRGILIFTGMLFLSNTRMILTRHDKTWVLQIVTIFILFLTVKDIIFKSEQKNYIAEALYISACGIIFICLRGGGFDILDIDNFCAVFICCYLVKIILYLVKIILAYLMGYSKENRNIVAMNNQDHRTEEELIIAAVHEAGHFVMAKLFGYKVDQLTIQYSEQTGNGGLMHSIPPDLIEEGYYKESIMIAYAGTIAEKVVLGTSYPSGRRSDLELATEMIKNYISSGETKYGLINLIHLTDQYDRLKLYTEISHDLEEETKSILIDHKNLIYYTKNELLKNKAFRNESEVDELWDRLMSKLTTSSEEQYSM
ncbi:hypothetical protein [Anaerostipes sp. PC18]|uniref:hypothetical protein n=2 Tax=Anaerostipes TaxID=207244 RepID=UPI003087F8AC|nr:hypothetical protein P8F77_06130 [Anaerostipes sp. PC18]